MGEAAAPLLRETGWPLLLVDLNVEQQQEGAALLKTEILALDLAAPISPMP